MCFIFINSIPCNQVCDGQKTILSLRVERLNAYGVGTISFIWGVLTMVRFVSALILIFTFILNVGVKAQSHNVDHIIVAHPDVKAGLAGFKDKSGVTPGFYGREEGSGLEGHSVAIGEKSYIYFVGPDQDYMPFDIEQNPGFAFADAVSRLPRAEIDMFVYATDDMDGVVRRAEELGLSVSGPYVSETKMDDGSVRMSSYAQFTDHEFGQFIPYVIQWSDNYHPADVAPKGVTLEGFLVEHPDATALGAIYHALGVNVSVKQSEKAKMTAKLSSSKGTFQLKSGPGLGRYYAEN